MNNTQAIDTPVDPAVIRRNRFYGVLIIVVIGLPMLLAYIMFHTGWGVSLNTTNKGELVQPPLPIQDITLVDNAPLLANIYNDNSGLKKWRILVPVTAACDKACQNNLYISRQVHIRLAEKAYRVERIVLALDGLSSSFESMLEKDHPNTQRAQTSLPLFAQWLAPSGFSENAQDHFYLVDQEGFAMMRYGVENTGQDLLDDLKKLLKFTYDK